MKIVLAPDSFKGSLSAAKICEAMEAGVTMIRQQLKGILAGLTLAAGIYTVGFSRLAKKNIRRICDLPGRKVCLFAFQAWTSYPLVAFMIGLGIYLRRYSSFPKPMLAILYLGIGSALFASSLHYFAHIASSRRLAPARD